VHYGLDVTWDVYIFIGTFFFALAMFGHEKFHKLYPVIGIIIALLMIIFNLLAFPNPPGDSGYIDMGPFIGLWYLAVTILIIIKYKKALTEIKIV
jgi:hypothetical protein